MSPENIQTPIEWEIMARENPREAAFDSELAFSVAGHEIMVETAEDLVIFAEEITSPSELELEKAHQKLSQGDINTLKDLNWTEANIEKYIVWKKALTTEQRLSKLARLAIYKPDALGIFNE